MQISRAGFLASAFAFGVTATLDRAFSQTQPTGKPIVINYGYASLTSIAWDIFIAQAKGFYVQEGIDFRPTFVSTGYPGVAQGIIAKAFQMGTLSADTAIPAIQNGADLLYVGSEMHVQPINLIVQPEIKSFADIKNNKKVGSNSLRGGTAMLLRLIFQQKGLKEGKDYDIIVSGSSNDRLAGLRTKELDIAMIGQPQDFQMMEAGFASLGYASDWLKTFGFVELWTKRSWAEDNQDSVVRFMRAEVRTMNWLYDPANKEEAINILAKATKTEDKYARATYDLLVTKLKSFTPRAEPSVEAIDETIRILVDAGEFKQKSPVITGASVTDTSYWMKALK